jgi:hypothetical protein
MTISKRQKGLKRIRRGSSILGFGWSDMALEARNSTPVAVHFRQAMTFSIECEISRRSHHHITCIISTCLL